MAKLKTDKCDILMSVIDAIFDFNQDAKVGTIYKDGKLVVPLKRALDNVEKWDTAQSFIIGDISVRKVSLPPQKGIMPGTMVNRFKYVVRTPKGEAEFDDIDHDCEMIWIVLEKKYLVNKVIEKDEFVKHAKLWFKLLENPKLKAHAVAAKVVEKDIKSNKFKHSAQKLKALGVKRNEKELEEKLEKEVRARALRRHQ